MFRLFLKRDHLNNYEGKIFDNYFFVKSLFEKTITEEDYNEINRDIDSDEVLDTELDEKEEWNRFAYYL